MSKRPSFQFYPGDWLKDPSLRSCSPATRGIWIDLLCAIHEIGDGGAVSGTIEQLARMTGCFPEEMRDACHELQVNEVAAVESDGDRFQVRKITVGRRYLPLRIRRDVLRAGRCGYCGATDQLSVDHIQPIKWGGTNDRHNLQCLCLSCNRRKGAKYG